MSVPRFLLALAAASSLAFVPARAQTSIDDIVGEYQLTSSTTAPASDWGYSKGRISVRRLDDRHAVFLLACQWKDSPKEVCGQHSFAQWRADGIYIEDLNNDAMRLYFDPARRQFMMISRGADEKGSVRHDVFAATEAPLTDPALVRRMKREQGSAMHKENTRVFGHYTRRGYAKNRIEFQRARQ